MDPGIWVVVGLSSNRQRTAHGVSRWMHVELGKPIIPVHPKAETVHGCQGYASLADIPDQDLKVVDCFVNSERVGAVVDDAIRSKDRLDHRRDLDAARRGRRGGGVARPRARGSTSSWTPARRSSGRGCATRACSARTAVRDWVVPAPGATSPPVAVPGSARRAAPAAPRPWRAPRRAARRGTPSSAARSRAASAPSPAPRIRAASSPALRAPPTDTVATGTPAGICTIESSESIPSRYFSGTGTPITGSEVTDASIPGRCAAPPAPAMITRSPRASAVRPYSTISSGIRCAETTSTSHATPSSSSTHDRGLHHRPVRVRAHDDADHRRAAARRPCACSLGHHSLDVVGRVPGPLAQVGEVVAGDVDVPDLATGRTPLPYMCTLTSGSRAMT